MREGLGGVDDQGDAMLAAGRRDRRDGLDDAAVAPEHGQVYQRWRIVRQRAGGGFGIETARAVDGENRDVEAVPGHGEEVRPVLTWQAGQLPRALPIAEQQVDRVARPGREDDVVGAESGECPDGGTTRASARARRPRRRRSRRPRPRAWRARPLRR